MKVTFIFGVFMLLTCFAVHSQSREGLVAGKLMVQFKEGCVPSVERRARMRVVGDTAVFVSGLRSFDRISSRVRTTGVRRVYSDAGKYEAKHRRYGLHRWYELTIPADADPSAVAKEYAADSSVLIAEPMPKRRLLRMNSVAAAAPVMPNDPYFSRQWNFHNTGQAGGLAGIDINLPEAWAAIEETGIKNRNVIIAEMDGGIDYAHNDLKANLQTGYNFTNNSHTVVPDYDGHGSHVAGIMAAVADNGIGVAGIARAEYGIKVMNVQIFDGETGEGIDLLDEAFAYAADNGAVIAQNSWGYSEKAGVFPQSDRVAMEYFINEAGKDENGDPRPGTPMVGGLIIFAAGNDGSSDKWYPAYWNKTIAVGAVNNRGERTYYSNYGNWVDIAAPGGEMTSHSEEGGIFSCSYQKNSTDSYTFMQGTSMACPHVSAVAALVLAVYGGEHFTPDMLREMLISTAMPIDEFAPDLQLGAGLVNAEYAIRKGNNNHVPEILLPSDTTLIPHIKMELDLSSYVNDLDGNPLSFSTHIEPPDKAKDTLVGNILTIEPLYHGEAVLHVNVYDPFSSASATVNLHIEQKYADFENGQLLIYPNPVDDELFYSFILKDEKSTVEVSIADLVGRVIYKGEKMTLAAGNQYFRMTVAGWQSGVYFLRYTVNGHKGGVKKWIKR